MSHGLPLEMETPDHASIWRFRQTTDKLGLSAALLAEVNRQLDARGFVIKRGTAHRRDPHRRRGQASLTCAAASIRATPRLVSRASATRPILAIRRIWRFLADRAYDSQALRETLEARGLVDGIA